MIGALVIARGGSKRLPRKNVRDFCGLPLTAWTLIQCQCAKQVDRVFLSTDDDEIEAIGRAWDAEIIRRPDWPDADKVAANRVFLHAIGEIEARGYDMDVLVSAFPTSPLRYPGDIDRGIDHFHLTGAYHVWPAYRPREMVIYKDVLGMIAKLVLFDKRKIYLMGNAGMFNVIRTAWYKWHVGMLTEKVGDHDSVLDNLCIEPLDQPDTDSYYVECEQFQLVETDTLEEFELAEVLMKHYILRDRGPTVYFEYADRWDLAASNRRQL